MILFTSDIDWASDEIIEDTLSLFEQNAVKCTLFATHASQIFSALPRSYFEIAIHPNFNTLLQGKTGDINNILDRLLEIYPDAKGVRSHSLLQSTQILMKFAEHGLLYDSNCYLPYMKNIRPFKLWNGMIRIPFSWEDDLHCMFGYSFEESRIDLLNNGLNIFNFHPIHVYLNTDSLSRYETAKKYSSDLKKLREFRNTKKHGVRDLLQYLLKFINSNNITTKTLHEVALEFDTII